MSDPDEMQIGIGLPMVVLAGTLYAVAANAVSYFADRSRKTGQPLTGKQQAALEGGAFCTYIVGGLLATAAYASGDPVPLLQGTLVATNLLLNMAMQILLGITIYTKSMRIGTMLFVAAIYQLSFVGPKPRGDDVDIMTFLSKPSAIVILSSQLGVCFLSTLGVYTTWNQSPESFPKIFIWASLIGVLGSLTDNAASTFGVMSGLVLFASFGTYGLVSVFVLGLSAKAPGLCDASIYVPLQLSIQLVLNVVNGIFVWGDLDRMADKPLQPYFVTFVFIILSVYVASPSADMVETMVAWRILRKTKLSDALASSTFGKAILSLMTCWHEIQTAPEGSPLFFQAEEAAREALKLTLSVGADRGRITSEDLVDLIIDLYGSSGSFAPSATLVSWLDKNAHWVEYMKLDPSFRERVLAVMPEGERTSFLQKATFVDVAGPTSFVEMNSGTPLADS